MKTQTKKQTKKAQAKNTCICGCKTETGSNFAPGHDSKLHSLVARVAKGEAKASEVPKGERAREYLARAPWMTKKMRDAIGLPSGKAAKPAPKPAQQPQA